MKTALLLLLMVSACSAQTYTAYGITFPQAHPRLWFNDAARLSRSRTWASANPAYNPGTVNQYSTYQTVINNAWFHVATGGTWSCAAAVNWVVNFQTANTYVPQPGDAGSDQVRNNGEAIALVYDWCYSDFTSGQRSVLVSSWNTWFGNVKQQTWGGLYNGVWMVNNNYFWGNLRNELEWGIATYGDNAGADGYMDYALNSRWAAVKADALTGTSLGGAFPEGMDYGSTTLWYPLIPFATAASGGRAIFSESDLFKQMLLFMFNSALPDLTYNVASTKSTWDWFAYNEDEHSFYGSNVGRQRNFYFADGASFLSNLWAANGIGKYARAWINTVSPTGTKPFVVDDTASATPLALSNMPLDYYAAGLKYLYTRSQWGARATVVQEQLGVSVDTAGHKHWDFGNFQIWRNGRWLLREMTGYSQNIPRYNNVGVEDVGHGIGHNIPVIGGQGPVGWHYKAAGPPVVKRLESASGYSYSAVDLTGAYGMNSGHPELANPAFAGLVREMLFIRSLETLVVLDRIEMKSPDGGTTPATSVKGTFVSHFEVTPTAIDNNHFTVTNGPQELYVSTLIPVSGAGYRTVTETTNYTMKRVELDYAGGSSSACNTSHSCIYFLHVFQGRDAGGASITASLADSSPSNPFSGTFTVTLHPAAGADTVAVFPKGMASSGGTINLAGAGATSLRADTQGISYTDSGAVWQSASPGRCDLNGDGVVDMLDVQIAIAQALGSVRCGSADLNGDGVCNLLDVQRIVRFLVLGGSC